MFFFFFFLMILRPPDSHRTATLFPDTTLFRSLRGAHRRERVAAALRFVALEDRQHDRVSTYSGGMQRRLNIAAAIVHEPALVLLDEPTVGVDPPSRNAIFENVLALKQIGSASCRERVCQSV